jgi:hypothetical protein
VTPETPARTAIEKYQPLTALLPQVQEAHGSMVVLHSKESPQLHALSQQELQIDAKHDAYVKLIYNALTVLAPGAANRDELLSLRDMLFPEKLQHMKRSYRGEVGHAVLVAKQMDAATQARLKAVQLNDKTLFDLYAGWQGTTKQLGDLEDQRAHLSQATPSAAKEIVTARNRWIRVVKAFLACAEVANLDAESDNLIFAPLRAAEQVADNRMRSKTAPAPAPASNPNAGEPKAG